MADNKPVLEIEDLSVAYVTGSGLVHAVNDVNLKVYPNEIVGLIGESGSGKSTMAYTIMRLLKGDAVVTKGRVKILGQDVYQLSKKELRQFRWSKMAMVFQSAMSALNPVMTVETQILDALLSHRKDMTKEQARARARELMELVRIDPKHLKSYPHELSGGMRQRVVIAIAIALNPALVIMDEPTTALDVVVQRSILDEIRKIQQEVGFAILFVSHDFSLVAELASRVAIMYAGRIIEVTPSDLLHLQEKHHPYTEGLLKAIPELTAEDVTIQGIGGYPPDLQDLPSGCAFHPRCPYATDICRRVRPEKLAVGDKLIECHLFSEKELVSHV
ncbi:oligopeptide/dipeptide ABC transporter, ATPase subunit [Alicyclobacillus hesperidum URH17-3-68]|uniref:Peptide ABC transporter ATP-binding protein n=1 Tax=Alicyclobacillus hesperidum TaxID=89784 RepID=A0A1H2TE82_9BACL|nr:ABC transporter ATP-binding protein [Alicyclobacillus hesperidum]EJY56035.1 oligopeptide/dipeptide ABC transporter, ATPase subunit [Alicyclobacillus hesperidum URH17-3-68]GLV13871.1 peptide ABC transporter ATP-binding protein [Alicyclobacillus hesperidum]SDW42246.1 peptide/nickel transport system ATP-binding protein [Alicyclobacillus hesperidum]